MSRLTDLIAQTKTKDAQLGADLEREFKIFSSRLPFGLNFERHHPEAVELPLRPIRKGHKVRVLPERGSTKKGDQRLWQTAGKSPGYVEKVLRVFSVVWNQAKAQGFVEGSNPVSKIKIPKSDGRRDRFLTKDEAARLLAALKERDQEAHDYAFLSLFTGLRAGECRDLVWADIDLEGGRIFVKDTKNTRNRHAFITAEVREMLTCRAQGRSKTDKVFPSAKGGIGYTTLWYKFDQTVKELGLNNGVSDRRQKLVFH